MRSIARCVLPVLVGPSTAVTLRMRFARSRLIRHHPHLEIVAEALQSVVTISRADGKKAAPPEGTCARRSCAPKRLEVRVRSMQQSDLRLTVQDDIHALRDDG